MNTKKLLQNGIATVVLIINFAIALAIIIMAREFLLLAMAAAGWQSYTISAIDKISILLLAIACLAFFIYTQYSYGEAISKGVLLQKIFYITSIQLFIVFGLHLSMIVLESMIVGWNNFGPKFFSWANLGILTFTLVAGVLLRRIALKGTSSP